MTLIKKTIVLAKNGARGYVTVVRVGSSIGAKVVVDYSGDKELIVGLKIGANELVVEKMSAPKAEIELGNEIDFKNSDEISCIILLQGQIYAEGGLRDRINIQDITQKLNKFESARKEVSYEQNKNISKEVGDSDKKLFQKDSSKDASQQRRGVIERSSEDVAEKLQYNAKQTEEINITSVINSNSKEVVEKTAVNLNSEEVVEKVVASQNSEEVVEKVVANQNSEEVVLNDVDDINIKNDEKSRMEEKTPPPTQDFAKDARSFYFSVKDKLDELFVMYPKEELLEKIIPTSKWVKINYDADDYYVAGVLIDDKNVVSHIGYGVPGFEGKSPPKEAVCICDWLPIKNMEKYQGYWLIFQSADTGEILSKD